MDLKNIDNFDDLIYSDNSDDSNNSNENYEISDHNTECGCINCIIPYESWISIGKYLRDNSVIDESSSSENEDEHISCNFDNKKILKKIYFPKKKIFFSNVITITENYLNESFEYFLIYKNDEVIIYNIYDNNFHSSIITIYNNKKKNLVYKIKIISDSRSEFNEKNYILIFL